MRAASSAWLQAWLACLILQGDKNTQMRRWCLAFFFFFFFLFSFLSFSSFAYELIGAVYQSWKMPQRGPDQRQALNCVLRWISLPNTLMWLKHKFHKQLFSICSATVILMLWAIHGIFLLQRYTEWIQTLFCTCTQQIGEGLEGLILLAG